MAGGLGLTALMTECVCKKVVSEEVKISTLHFMPYGFGDKVGMGGGLEG